MYKPTQQMTQDIADFHAKFGLDFTGYPRPLPHSMSTFRQKFLQEEVTEYKEAVEQQEIAASEGDFLGNDDQLDAALEQQLDALVDIVYVALGTAYLHGFDFEEAWKRVHARNMEKVRGTAETSKRGSAFDIVKPPGWEPASLRDLAVPTIKS